jgi:hypothetical protein
MNFEKIAIKKVKNIINFKKRFHESSKRITPSPYAKRKYERTLGQALRDYKTGKNKGNNHSSRNYYPVLLEVALEKNEPNLFEYVDKKQKAINNLTNAFEWVLKNGRFPNHKKEEQTLRKVFENFKAIKSGKLAGIWYRELDEIASKYGYPEIFKNDLENTVVNVDVKDLIRFYKKFSKKPTQLSENPEERKLYTKLIRLKQIKAGKTCQLWNPVLDEQIKKAKIKNIFA